MLNSRCDASFMASLFISVSRPVVPFTLSPHKRSDLRLSFVTCSLLLLSALGFPLCVCVCGVGLCWWSHKPQESAQTTVYPAAHSVPSSTTAFKSTGKALKARAHSLSVHFSPFICIRAPCWLIAFVGNRVCYQNNQISPSFTAELCALQRQPSKAPLWVLWQDEVPQEPPVLTCFDFLSEWPDFI